MPTVRRRTDALNDSLAAFVADDEELIARVRRFYHAILDDAEAVVRLGDTKDRAVLLGNILPGLLRQATMPRNDDAELRRVFEETMAAVRGDSV